MLLGWIIGYSATFLFEALLFIVLMRYIFAARVITANVLYAAAAAYWILGVAFVPVYGFVDVATFTATGGMHAFSGPGIEAGQWIQWQDLMYYSYATLTTLGYGDILPATLWARSIASLEAVFGVLYMAIIVARLVGLFSSRDTPSESE